VRVLNLQADYLSCTPMSTLHTVLSITLGLVHAGVSWIVTLFSNVTAVASQALPALPGASPAREGHHADL